ncbi:MAG: alginate export family protein [Crocinitomicaceae bacterium]|nr:alginate export family protein [Crocinitomicaceae bacterium]
MSAQDTLPEPKPEFKIDYEFRPRAEFRNGYRMLRSEDTKPAAFISQRNRLNLDFKMRSVHTYLSIADARFWGDRLTTEGKASLYIFEAWAELGLSNKWTMKAGRQRIIYDNQRLFSESNWTQEGRSHDAVFLKYRDEKTEFDIGTAYNETEDHVFGTDYDTPNVKGNYKYMGILWFTHKMGNSKLTLLNVLDGFQATDTSRHFSYARSTNGGRFEWTKNKFYATVSGYVQFGQTPASQDILAYYIQPEIKFSKVKKFTFRLGVEYLSGNDATLTYNKKSNTFVPLYGVAHRFMGAMDYFTRFPSDVKGAGLINPYMFIFYDFTPSVTLRSDFHLFFLQNKYFVNSKVIDPYLGFENDIKFNFRVSKEVMLEIGYSWMAATRSMEYIRGGDSALFPQWAYVMFSVNPTLFSTKK